MAEYNHALRTHGPQRRRVDRATRPHGAVRDDQQHEEGRMLVKPAFWIAGLISIAAWVGIAALFR